MNLKPFIIFCWLLFGLFCEEAYTQEIAAKTAPEQTEIQSVIDTLENPETRERLIGQLRLLIKTPIKQWT